MAKKRYMMNMTPKKQSSQPKSGSGISAGASKSPTGAGTSSFGAEAAPTGRLSKAAEGKSTNSTRKGSKRGASGLTVEGFLESLSSVLSLAPKVGIALKGNNLGWGIVRIQLEEDLGGLRLCPGTSTGSAHIVTRSHWDDVTGRCQNCAAAMPESQKGAPSGD